MQKYHHDSWNLGIILLPLPVERNKTKSEAELLYVLSSDVMCGRASLELIHS